MNFSYRYCVFDGANCARYRKIEYIFDKAIMIMILKLFFFLQKMV